MKQKNIFLGTQDIASLFGYYKKGYEKLGYKVTTCSFPHKYSHNQPKYNLTPDAFFLKKKLISLFQYQLNPDENSKIKQNYLRFIFWLFFSTLNVFVVIANFLWSFFIIFQKIHWIMTIQKYDIFHFIWIQDYSEELEWRFWWIKYFNKKIIVNFVGDDVRWSPLLIEEYQKLGFEYEKPEIFVEKVYNTNSYADEFLKRLKYTRIAEKYADMILSVPDQSQLLLRPYYNFYLPIEIQKKQPLSKKQKEKPNILHAVALRIVKGTDTLIEKMNNIKNKYGDIFDFVCVEDKTPEEIKMLLQEADIVVYCLIGQGPGMFGLETMLHKTLLMTGNNEKYLKYPTADMVVDTDFNNLEEKLLFYIQNPQKRIEMTEIAYQNVCKHNDMYVVCENIIKQLYNPHEKHIFLHFPTYFNQFAKLDSKYDLLDKNTINQWTNFVKNCDWYKENVRNGERNGLKL